MSVELIQDGQYYRGYVAAKEGGWGECRFVYRPCWPIERRLFGSQAQGTEDEIRKYFGKVFFGADGKTARITEWNVTSNGQPAPITIEAMLRLPPVLLDSILLIVLGQLASDTDPTWNLPEGHSGPFPVDKKG